MLGEPPGAQQFKGLILKPGARLAAPASQEAKARIDFTNFMFYYIT